MSRNKKKMQATTPEQKIIIEDLKENFQQASDNKYQDEGNILDSALTDDIKFGINEFVNTAQESMCSALNTNINSNTLTKEMLTKLSANIRTTFEKNMELSQDFLKCKTAVEMLELQHKTFENNYSNTIKLYSDFMQTVQNITAENIRISSDYLEKNFKFGA